MTSAKEMLANAIYDAIYVANGYTLNDGYAVKMSIATALRRCAAESAESVGSESVLKAATELVDYVRPNWRKHITEVNLIRAVDALYTAPQPAVPADVREFERTLCLSLILAINTAAKIGKMTNDEALAITTLALSRIDERRALASPAPAGQQKEG